MEKIKKSYKHNELKISAPTQNKEFELADESCSVSDIQDYFQHILKKHKTVADNLSVKIYVNKQKIELRLK